MVDIKKLTDRELGDLAASVAREQDARYEAADRRDYRERIVGALLDIRWLEADPDEGIAPGWHAQISYDGEITDLPMVYSPDRRHAIAVLRELAILALEHELRNAQRRGPEE